MGAQQPPNTSLLIPNKFVLSFARLPNVQFFCQTVNLPGINLGTYPRSTPFVDYSVPGEKLIYDPLTVTFLVDEDLATWREIHDWMRGLGFPTDFQEYRDLNKLSKVASTKTPQVSDAAVVILNSNTRGNYRFKFIDAFPSSLAPFTLSTLTGSETVLTADATFSFSYFDIEKI